MQALAMALRQTQPSIVCIDVHGVKITLASAINMFATFACESNNKRALEIRDGISAVSQDLEIAFGYH